MPLIFQYGSNCDRSRLEGRLNERVEDRGRALTVEGFEIAFNVNRRVHQSELMIRAAGTPVTLHF